MIAELIRAYLRHHAARRRRQGSLARIASGGTAVQTERSPAPSVLIAVLIWAVCAVLLTLSAVRQQYLADWRKGQFAPFSVKAQVDFKYYNSSATEKARSEARRTVPLVFHQQGRLTEGVRTRLNSYFMEIAARDESRKAGKVYRQLSTPGSQLAAATSPGLLDALSKEGLSEKNYVNYANLLRQLLTQGIMQEKESRPLNAGQLIRKVDDNRRFSQVSQPVREFPTPAGAAQLLARALIPQSRNFSGELTGILTKLIGPEGTMSYDAKQTRAMADRAAAEVKDIQGSYLKGELLVAKGEEITEEIVDMLKAQRRILPKGQGIEVFYYRMCMSFFLLLVTLFFLYRLYPDLFLDSRQFALGGSAVILSLVLNYAFIQEFDFLFREGLVGNFDQVINAVPVMLGPVLISALMGNRAAIAAGFLISAVTAMMVLPDRSFELALRWMGISMLGALLVRNVTNYRSYFLRVFSGSFVLSLAVTADLIFFVHNSWRELGYAALVILGSSFVCSVGSLLLIFAFELLFNVDTNMSLMVLCDYNHPLLERLKREAPGTMFHSMSVATLAEDAAREIGANPLKAKAGALFHDIGKLVLPQYFVENNLDSSSAHQALTPQVSSMIIRDHVKEGLLLARKYRLCRLVSAAIGTHHGDDLVTYFYHRALEEKKKKEDAGGDSTPVLESQFRYAGLPPRGKELTLISLADACEAACRSLNKPTPGKIQAMINDIFIKRLQGGQLRNSELTLEELNKVRECFISTLISIHHGRIAYQPEEKYESDAKPLDAPAAPPAGQ